MKKLVSVVDEETIVAGRVLVVATCNTIAEAEQWIADQEKISPDKVHRGGYGIDAPETLLNPWRK